MVKELDEGCVSLGGEHRSVPSSLVQSAALALALSSLLLNRSERLKNPCCVLRPAWAPGSQWSMVGGLVQNSRRLSPDPY